MSRRNTITADQLRAQGYREVAPDRWDKWDANGDHEMHLQLPAPPAQPAKPPPKANPWSPFRNKTEWRAAQWLAERWSPEAGYRVAYESLRLCLGTIDGVASYYTPDFPVWQVNYVRGIYEVKGNHRWRRGGIDRLRAAAALYPEFEWWLMEPEHGAWSIKRVEG